MLKNILDRDISKRQTLEIIKEKLKEERELHLRKTLSEDSFDKPDWSKYLAYQLGYIAALEKLDKFVPDPVSLND